MTNEEKVKFNSKVSFALSKLRRAGKINEVANEGKRGKYWYINSERWALT